MLSRIFWVGIAGIALITGMMLQDGRMFTWGHEADQRTERAITEGIERSVAGSVDQMQVIDPDGREIDVPPEMKRAMAEAVGRLVEAEAELAVAKIRGDASEDMQSATTRRDAARAEVDRLKAEIKGHEQAAAAEHDAVREQVQREIRDEVRAAVRDAAGN